MKTNPIGRPRLSNMEILVGVITKMIEKKRRQTGVISSSVCWKRDGILHELEKELIRRKRMKPGYVLNEYGKRSFTILLQQAARETQDRYPFLIISGGSQKNRQIFLFHVSSVMSAGR